jgi:hypothetical protein
MIRTNRQNFSGRLKIPSYLFSILFLSACVEQENNSAPIERSFSRSSNSGFQAQSSPNSPVGAADEATSGHSDSAEASEASSEEVASEDGGADKPKKSSGGGGGGALAALLFIGPFAGYIIYDHIRCGKKCQEEEALERKRKSEEAKAKLIPQTKPAEAELAPSAPAPIDVDLPESTPEPLSEELAASLPTKDCALHPEHNAAAVIDQAEEMLASPSGG